ncbi:hypothetical protein M9H77_11208 [Catharanthus roseus]|uniref:Uncharacterized protein n=1 Tax=Catharanthus roseus TaxID=4058 RepID=A0ACC0BDW4_CATRO|nr:hypothetical protein M9H77_11208 [Catharanthus roseus]
MYCKMLILGFKFHAFFWLATYLMGNMSWSYLDDYLDYSGFEKSSSVDSRVNNWRVSPGDGFQVTGSAEGAVEDDGCVVGAEDESGVSELADTCVCMGGSTTSMSMDPALRRSSSESLSDAASESLSVSSSESSLESSSSESHSISVS